MQIQFGMNALIQATLRGNTNGVQMLLEAGVDKDAKTDVRDSHFDESWSYRSIRQFSH